MRSRTARRALRASHSRCAGARRELDDRAGERGRVRRAQAPRDRVGDNAVDIGEQTALVVTGLFREFTDATHVGRH